MGYSQTIEEAGGIFARTCMATIPDCPIPSDVKTVATHSFKTAHYVDRISKGRIRVVVGELEKCVHAAIRGKWEGASV
jgi:predicted aconitase